MTAFTNPPDREIAEQLRRARTIAVVGLSADPSRPSHEVAAALQRAGYRIVPVRPGGGEILGEPVRDSLADAGADIDLVDVFRAPEHVPAIVDEVVRLGLPALWLQDGVVDAVAAARASAAGIFVVMDRCIKRDGLPLLESEAPKALE